MAQTAVRPAGSATSPVIVIAISVPLPSEALDAVGGHFPPAASPDSLGAFPSRRQLKRGRENCHGRRSWKSRRPNCRPLPRLIAHKMAARQSAGARTFALAGKIRPPSQSPIGRRQICAGQGLCAILLREFRISAQTFVGYPSGPRRDWRRRARSPLPPAFRASREARKSSGKDRGGSARGRSGDLTTLLNAAIARFRSDR